MWNTNFDSTAAANAQFGLPTGYSEPAHGHRQFEVQFLMRATLIVVLAALLIASAQQATQTPAAAPQKKAAPADQTRRRQERSAPKKSFSFSDTVQLVVVDVFAKDKNGNPIEGLKPEDFADHRRRQAAEDHHVPIPGICRTIPSPHEPDSNPSRSRRAVRCWAKPRRPTPARR